MTDINNTVSFLFLDSSSVPNVPAFKTQIGSVEVSSVPDALVIHPTCENLIMASVEVLFNSMKFIQLYTRE